MSLRIAVWAPAAREPILGALSSFGGLEIVEATSARQFIAALEGAKAAVVPGLPQFYTQEVAAAVAASPTLAWVHISSAGYEGLWGAPWPGGVRFTHPGGAASGAVGAVAAVFTRYIGGVLSSIVGAWLLVIGALAALHSAGELVNAVASQPWGVILAAALFAVAGSIFQLFVRPSPEEAEKLRIEKAKAKRRAAEKRELEKRWSTYGTPDD